jgi:hypothetical protein
LLRTAVRSKSALNFILFDRCSIAFATEHHHPFANDLLISLERT